MLLVYFSNPMCEKHKDWAGKESHHNIQGKQTNWERRVWNIQMELEREGDKLRSVSSKSKNKKQVKNSVCTVIFSQSLGARFYFYMRYNRQMNSSSCTTGGRNWTIFLHPTDKMYRHKMSLLISDLCNYCFPNKCPLCLNTLAKCPWSGWCKEIDIYLLIYCYLYKQ